MKIQTTIPDDAIDDVREYCRIMKIDLHGRMQDNLDAFVANARWWIGQRKQINEGINNFQETIKEIVHGK